MITFSDFKSMHESNVPGRARKMQSDVIMKETWWQDIQSQVAYFYDAFHDLGIDHYKLNDLNPIEDPNKTPIPIKFIKHMSQGYTKDQVTYWLQFQPGQECNIDYYIKDFQEKYHAKWPVGLYCDVCDENGKYNKWLVVGMADYNQNQFPTWELLRCDYVLQWIHAGKKYECPGVLQSQSSYNSGLWTDNVFTSVQDQQKIALPLSSITETLTYNHRLLIDSYLYEGASNPNAWLISKTKRISPNGIIVVTTTQDLFNQHTDYIEKNEEGKIIGMWADYYVSEVEPTAAIQAVELLPPSSITSVITCTGRPQFKVGGSAKTFTVSYYNEENEQVQDHPPGEWSFSIDDTPLDTELLTLTPSADGVKIKVKFLGDDSYIGKILTITNTAEDVAASLRVEIIAL